MAYIGSVNYGRSQVEVYFLVLEINFLRTKMAPKAPIQIAGEYSKGIGIAGSKLKAAALRVPVLLGFRSYMVKI
jgi:hypothetical protein